MLPNLTKWFRVFTLLSTLLTAFGVFAQISIVAPNNNTRWREGDVPFFTWQSEPDAADENRYDYKVYFFEADRGISKEDAVNETPFYTFDVANDRFPNQKTIGVPDLADNKEYFWFVQSLQGGIVISSTDTANFYAPWFAESFYVQNTKIDFDTLITFDPTNLSGSATVSFDNKPTPTTFSGISIDRSGGLYTLTSGSLSHSPDTTAIISLSLTSGAPIDKLVFERESFTLNSNGNFESGSMTIHSFTSGQEIVLEDISLETVSGVAGYRTATLEVEQSVTFGNDIALRVDQMVLTNSAGTYLVSLDGLITLPENIDIFEDLELPFTLATGEGEGSIDLFTNTLANEVVDNIAIPLDFSFKSFSVDASNTRGFESAPQELEGVRFNSTKISIRTGIEQDGVMFETGELAFTHYLDFGTTNLDIQVSMIVDIDGTWLGHNTNFRAILLNSVDVRSSGGYLRGFAPIPLIEGGEIELIAPFDSEHVTKPSIHSFEAEGTLHGYQIAVDNVTFEDAEDLTNSTIHLSGTMVIDHLSEDPIPFTYSFDNSGSLTTMLTIDGEEWALTPPYIRSVDNITESSVTITYDQVDDAVSYFASVFELGSDEVLTNFDRISVGSPAIITGLPDETDLSIIIGTIHPDNSELTSLPVEITTLEKTLGKRHFSSRSYYPNPVKNDLTIDLLSGESISIIKIFDISGIEISLPIRKESKKILVDTSKLAEGIYLIKLFGDEDPTSFTFVKN